MLKSLLRKLEIIEYKYNSNSDSFNIFTILRGERDEVNLHSKFIYELLNPQGSHNQQSTFLEIFLGKIGVGNGNFRLFREKHNIDILLESDTKAIIIENKIDTTDHSNQLSRYISTLKGRGFKDIQLLYLTLNGDEPNEKIENLKLISYKYDIKGWIEGCIEKVATKPTLRETLVQYLNLINRLTYRIDNMGHIMEVKDLLLQGDNLKLILNIEDAILEAKIEVQLIFWKTLLNKLRAKYRFEFYSYYEYRSIEESVRNYYTKKKNRKDYGYEYKLDRGLYFYIEIRDNIYYGFHNSKGSFSQTQQDILDNLNVTWEAKYWKYPEKQLNFEYFKSDNVLSLLNKAEREIDIDRISNEIVYIIENYKKGLNSVE